jgi:hypothetical protein
LKKAEELKIKVLNPWAAYKKGLQQEF